jgi:hypothetical protein
MESVFGKRIQTFVQKTAETDPRFAWKAGGIVQDVESQIETAVLLGPQGSYRE